MNSVSGLCLLFVLLPWTRVVASAVYQSKLITYHKGRLFEPIMTRPIPQYASSELHKGQAMFKQMLPYQVLYPKYQASPYRSVDPYGPIKPTIEHHHTMVHHGPRSVSKSVRKFIPMQPPVQTKVSTTTYMPSPTKQVNTHVDRQLDYHDVASSTEEPEVDSEPSPKQPSVSHEPSRKYKFQPYAFGFEADDGWGNKQYRHEKSSEPGSVRGSYGFMDKDGIYRHVDYMADKNGFRAKIRSSEPGMETKNPASVFIDSKPIVLPVAKNAPKSTEESKKSINIERSHTPQEPSKNKVSTKLRSARLEDDYLDASNSEQLDHLDSKYDLVVRDDVHLDSDPSDHDTLQVSNPAPQQRRRVQATSRNYNTFAQQSVLQ